MNAARLHAHPQSLDPLSHPLLHSLPRCNIAKSVADRLGDETPQLLVIPIQGRRQQPQFLRGVRVKDPGIVRGHGNRVVPPILVGAVAVAVAA